MKNANNAPLYVGMYPGLAEICRKHGYALSVHGSVARDFDLIAVPWADNPSEPQAVVNEIVSTFAVLDRGFEVKNHGRICYVLVVSFGECFLDLSFMPRQTQHGNEQVKVCEPS
jgi:hypothetical protein